MVIEDNIWIYAEDGNKNIAILLIWNKLKYKETYLGSTLYLK